MINDTLMHKRFTTKPSYSDLLFKTTPGLTGLMLLIIIVTMSITSLACTRRRHFQLFSLVHFIGFPLFLILMIIHGSESWFNWGWPLTLITVPALILIVSLHYLKIIWDVFFRTFRIVDISMTASKEFIMIYVETPRSYRFKPGQYVFINCPEIKRFQWHPFSIASSP